MDGVDDADASAGGDAFDRLGVLEVWVHHCARVDEPGAEVFFRVVGVFGIASDFPGGSEGGDVGGETDHGLTVGNEVVGVGHAVFLDVRAGGVVGIGPPVVAFGE